MNRLFLIIYGLFLLSSSRLMAQDPQLAGFSFTRFPGAEVKNAPLYQKVEVNEYNFFLNLPWKLKNEKTILIHGLQYRLVTPFADNDPNSDLDKQKLHLIGYRFTALHSLTDDLEMLVSLNPTLSSTFNTKLEEDDFLFNGTLLFVKKKSDRFSYGGGVAYMSTFGEPGFIPVLQLTHSSEKHKLQVLLPRRIAYDHYFGTFTAGLQAEISGSRYNLNYSGTNSSNETKTADRLAYSRITFGPALSYRPAKIIQLEASGGITLARRAEVQDDLFEDENYEIASGPFFRLGIAIILPKKVKN